MGKKRKLDASSVSLLKRIWRDYTRRYIGKVFLSLFFMMMTAVSTALLAKLIQPMMDDVFEHRDLMKLYNIAFLVFITFVAKGIGAYGEAVTMNFIGQRIISDIQDQLMKRLVSLDLIFFQSTSSGELIARCTNDVTLMRATVSGTLTSLGKDIVMVACLLAVLFYQDILLASLAFIVFPVAILPLVKIGKRMRKVTINSQEETAEYTTLLGQTFQGARVVKAYAMEEYEYQRTHNVIERLFVLLHRSGRTKALSRPLMETLGGCAIVGIIIYGGWQVIEGDRTAGTFFSFNAALLLAYEPMKRLANLNANLQEGLASAQRVFHILDQRPTIVDCENAISITHAEASKDLTFDKTSFEYDSGFPILRDISFKVKAGTTVALVGPSGSGKSTLLNLIPRFYEATSGSVKVNGTDVRDITLKSLRQRISLVSQEIMLFDDTVRANIAYGRQEASEQDIINAAKGAAAHDFIMKLPNGYDTVVGENGTRLSGGQRQRIAIARAMVKNAPILLLDEATSALDTESEKKVQHALENLMKGKTVIVIAHRLSTIQNADKIHVLEEGQIVESGTHETLLKKGTVYAKLHKMQFKSPKESADAQKTI